MAGDRTVEGLRGSRANIDLTSRTKISVAQDSWYQIHEQTQAFQVQSVARHDYLGVHYAKRPCPDRTAQG